MIFDAQVQVIGLEVVPPVAAEDGTVEDGAHVALTAVLGLGMPVSPTQIAQIPAGVLRMAISGEQAAKVGQELIDAAAQVPVTPAQSDIVTASSMADVERAAKIADQFRGKK